MIKTDLYSWQIILLHMQEDLLAMKQQLFIVEDGLGSEDPLLNLIREMETNIEALYRHLLQQTESAAETKASEDDPKPSEDIPL